MAESQGKDRSVIVPKPQRMISPFSPGLSTDSWNPPSPAEVGNHVVARLKEAGLPHEPDMILGTVGNLMGASGHPKLVFSPGKGSTSNFQDNVGWKLRLNTGRDVNRPPDDLDDHIMKFLVSQGYGGYEKVRDTSGGPTYRKNYELPPGMERMGSFKRGSGGEQWPEKGIFQNYTIYTGPRKETETLAKKLERNFGDYLKDGMSGEEAMFTPHVGARFVYDNRIFDDTYDRNRLFYHNGNTSLGVPLPTHYVFGYGDARWSDPSISLHEAARAHDLLWSILSPDYYGPPIHQQVRKSMKKSRFNVSINSLLRKSEEYQRSAPEYPKDRPGRIWSPANTASFFSPDPEINRRVKVSNALALTHSLLDYQDPNDFLDHEDPSKRAYAKFLLHHVVRDTAAHPIDDSWLESVRDILGQEHHDYEKWALDSLPDKEGIEKHNQEMLDTYVEKPAHPAVKRALAAGYRPVQSDAFGDWGKKGALAYRFSPRTPGTGGGEDDDNEMSGKITFFPSTHEDFVNAGTEPPPGIGHDSTPTTDIGWFFKSMKKSRSYEPLRKDLKDFDAREWIGMAAAAAPVAIALANGARSAGPIGAALSAGAAAAGPVMNMVHGFQVGAGLRDDSESIPEQGNGQAFSGDSKVERFFQNTGKVAGKATLMYGRSQSAAAERDAASATAMGRDITDRFRRTPETPAPTIADTPEVSTSPTPRLIRRTRTVSPSTPKATLQPSATPTPPPIYSPPPTLLPDVTAKSWFSVSINPALSKKISWGRAIETERPTHEGLFPPQRAELEEVLGSVGLGHLASQYRQHLDEQERRGGAQGNHPLVLMSSDAYRRMLAHNKAAHRARRIPRENERESMGNREGGDGMPYGYDERGGSLGGESFKDSQGRKFLVVRDFSPSEEPHDKGNSIPMSSYVAGNGLIPIGSMHSHPPSAFGSQPSAPDLYIAENGGANSPLNLIMYPYGPETEEPYEGFTAVAGTGNGQPVRGDRDALDASAYGRIAHTRAMYSEIGADKQARISAMDPRNIIVYDARKGGYALTPDEFGRGIHGPSLIPGEHFTAGPQVTESGYLMRNPVGNAGSDLIPRAPGIAEVFGATENDIDPLPSRGTEPADIASRRETAKSWFNVSINPALGK